MALAVRLERFLNQQGIAYKELPITKAASLDEAVSALGQPRGDVIKATLLIDISGILMVVQRYDSTLDTEALLQMTGRH
ncbi:MAG: histidine kinase, partial [Marinobacter sp.]